MGEREAGREKQIDGHARTHVRARTHAHRHTHTHTHTYTHTRVSSVTQH